MIYIILDLYPGHVGGDAQKNILSILLGAPAVLGEHCLVIPERLVASQENRICTKFALCKPVANISFV